MIRRRESRARRSASPLRHRRGPAAFAALLALALLSGPAHAGPPQHNFLSTLTGSATPAGDFDKACGTAVDSAGNVYVASAGNDAIEVFTPTHSYLATITNANKPCGLAVDSDGDLYVTETDVLATGTSRVVRYTPDTYPLPASPSWSDPEPIDSSGQAKGIAVDPTDDRLYVARGDRIAAYQDDGTLGVDEVQRVFIRATGGSFTLSFRGQTTGPIAFDASPAQIEAALEALSTIGPGNVSVSRVLVEPPFTVSDVTFVGALGATDVERLVGDPSGLTVTSGSPGANVETQTQGFDGLIGDGGDLTAATGVAAYTSSSGDRYLFAADAASDEVKVFADPSVPSGLAGADIRELELSHTIDGSAAGDLAADATPDGSLGFGTAGAYLGVDPASGHVLVYDHAHTVVDEFEATGAYVTQMDRPEFADAEPTGIAVYPHRDEVQRLTISATGGTFTLAFEGDVTDPLPHNATAAQVQAALEGLPAIGAGNVFVSGGFDRAFGLRPHRVVFRGPLGGRNLDPIVADGSALTADAATATISTLIEGSGPGRVYVSAGSGPGARLLAFGPFAPASRAPLPALSSSQTGAEGAAVDSQGNFYVAAGSFIRVFSPAGVLLTTINNGNTPQELAVDGAGNLYVQEGLERVVLYRPSVYPFGASPSYGPPETVAEAGDGSLGDVGAIGVNPANGHLFVGDNNQGNMVELDSAANGSGIVNGAFGAGLFGAVKDVAAYGRTGEVYVGSGGEGSVRIVDPTGTRLLRKIDGSDSPSGNVFNLTGIDVDQRNGHVVVSRVRQAGVIDEFEGSGAFVAQIGGFPVNGTGGRVALDNSGGPNQGNLYLAYIDDLSAFGPLSYGAVPAVVTGTATGIGGGSATLNGTVDPRGFPVTDCHFEYTPQDEFEANGFAATTAVPCAESAAEIGSGTGPVAVHAEIGGLDPQGRYRFRLVAANEFGTGAGEARPFGPPLVGARRASGVHYTEAVLNARLDPSGLATTYRFEYGSQGPCDANPCASTPQKTLAAAAPAADVKAPVVGLAEGTTYHFRLVAENAAGAVAGTDGGFTTLFRPVEQSCPNAAVRTGPSAALPDCRAYELVTLADTGGAPPRAVADPDVKFNNWLVTPTGPGAGNSLVYFLGGTAPGIDGSGYIDGLRARRGPTGWTSALFGPTYAEAAGDDSTLQSDPAAIGVDPTHDYSAWHFDTKDDPLSRSAYLGTPAGFEPLGRGSLGTDPDARADFVRSGAGHVVFSSDDRLEPAAPPADTMAVYDRSPGGPTRVVSLLPGPDGGVTPAAGQHAAYQGISEDGSAIAFKIAGTLYVRRANAETVKVADAPNTFAGLSDDGGRIFYAATPPVGAGTNHLPPATLHAFDLGPHTTTQIAADSIFVNVSADGSRVYFTSQQQLGDAPPPADLSDKLYLWDGSSTRFVAALAPEDLENFDIGTPVNLARWAEAVAPPVVFIGRASAPSRATADGRLLLFQSHGDLTGQNPDGFSQVYRYDSADATVVCVSCPPGGEPAAAKATLQNPNLLDSGLQPAIATTLIPNLTVDGQAAFFETSDSLLPEDTNGKLDVYQWRAAGSGGCTRPGGCQALISTGRAGSHSFLYSMTPHGSDVFFSTAEQLVAADAASSISIYDARVGGGFAEGQAEPCVEDACQSPAGTPPAPVIASVTFVGAGNGETSRTAKVKVLKKTVRGALISLNVKVPGAGVIAGTGRNLKGSKKRVAKPGTYKLTLRLTERAKRALKRRKRMKLTLRVRFTPRVGEASQARVSLIAKRPARKARRAHSTRGADRERGGRR